jgi:hypothetical protein
MCLTKERFSVSKKVTQTVPSHVSFPNTECVTVQGGNPVKRAGVCVHFPNERARSC